MPRQAEPLHSTRLFHCITLALLLHVWLVLVVGTAPSGTAKPGDGVWGSLNVSLRGPHAEPGDNATALPVPPTPANAGPVGSGRQERFGGAVRPLSAPAELPKTPGAARLGAWSDTAVAEPVPVPVPVPVPAPAPPRPQPLPLPLPESPPLLAAEPVPTPTAVKPVEATPLESRPQPRLLSFDAAPAAVLERLTRPVPPALPAAPVTKLEPLPQRESVKTAPAPVPLPVPVPLPAPAPAAPVPAAPLLAAPMRLEAIELRPALPPLSPPVLTPVLSAAPQPLVAKPVAMPAAARIAPPERLLPAADVEFKTQPSTKPATELVPPAQPARLPPTAATAATAPIASSPAAHPQSNASTAAASNEASNAATNAPSNAPANTAANPATRAAASAAKSSSIDPGLLGLVPGAPDAGPRVGQDVATPPSASASAPRLNLQWVPPRGGELSSRGSRGVLQLLPVPPEHKSKLAEDLEKAGKTDCRKAYSGAGLLALLPLALDAARDKGCQW